MSENYFAEMAKINVTAHVEKKGQFSYLSWPFAVTELGKIDPTATWEVRRFDGMPYCKTDCGYFVEVAVTCKGVIKSQIHPVLDSRNKPIQAPTAFDINTSIQRCLVKAIALHGLGLYIYAGEDLPDGEPPKDDKPKSSKSVAQNCWDELREDQKKEVQTVADCVIAEFENKGASASLDMLREESRHWEPEYKAALTSRFPADMKKAWNKLDKERKESESLVGA